MVTRQNEPSPGPCDRQRRPRHRAVLDRRTVAALSVLFGMVAAIALGGCASTDGGALQTTAQRHGSHQLTADQSGRLRPGRHWLQRGNLRISFRVPTGWSRFGNVVLGPDHTGLGFWLVDRVSLDPCRWQPPGSIDLDGEDAGESVEDLVTALSDLPGDATTPVDVTMAGFHGKLMQVTVPRDVPLTRVDFSKCDQSDRDTYYASWLMNGGARNHQGQSQIDRLWILDIDHQRLLVNAAFFPYSSPQARQELRRIVNSIRIR